VSAAPIIRIITQREECDCAVVALAMYLGATYEDVLRLVTVTDRKQGRTGLWRNTMVRIAKRLGHTLKVRTAIDWNEDYGVLRLPTHAVILRNGLVIDTDGTIWDADLYLGNLNVRPDDCELLVADE